jgi:2-dehydropantoate 2-reductase
MRVAIVGAGGIGGYYGGLLARAGHQVFMLARGENLTAIRANGVIVKTLDQSFSAEVTASDDARELSESFADGDVVLITTKSYSLPEIAPAAKILSDRGATVVPLNNGVEAAETLVQLGIPRTRLLGGVTYISAVHVEPGMSERLTPIQRVIVGELDGGVSKRAEDIASMFRGVGVDGQPSADITLSLWQKFVFLSSIAAGCGLTRLPIGGVRAKPLGARLLERAVQEAVAVGRARGVHLRDDEEAQVVRTINALPASVEPSLLLDIRNGSRTEIDVLSGAISRFGDHAGIDTPVHDVAAVALVQVPAHSI